MDNELMPRRLRPPSEPVQQTPQPSVDHNALQMPDWMPSASPDEVPWDRPTDYNQPTDSASSDQPAWDQPIPIDWPAADSADGADQRQDFHSDPDVPVAHETLSAWPLPAVESQAAVAAVSQIPDQPAESITIDPDDAYAPVLGDLNLPMARGWPEMNGHDNGRNDPTVISDPNAVAPSITTPVPASIPDAAPPAPLPAVDSVVRNYWDEPTGMAEEWPTPEAPALDWDKPRPQPEPSVASFAPPQFASSPIHATQPVEPMPWTQPTRAWDPLAQLPAPPLPSPQMPRTYAPQPMPAAAALQPMFVPQPEPHSPPVPIPFEPPAPYEQSVAPATFAPSAYQEPTRAAVMAAPAPTASAQAATASAQNQSELWFLSTEPTDVVETRDDDIYGGKEPSPVLTAVLTIGMALLVIVLVLVFIQLMTSLLR